MVSDWLIRNSLMLNKKKISFYLFPNQIWTHQTKTKSKLGYIIKKCKSKNKTDVCNENCNYTYI